MAGLAAALRSPSLFWLLLMAAAALGAPPPRAVVHAGPMKTGSTALQEALIAPDSGLRRLVEREDAVVVPTIDGVWTGALQHLNIMMDQRSGRTLQRTPSGRALTAAARRVASSPGAQLLISAEVLSDPDADGRRLLELLAPPLAAVEVVLVYRPYHEWAVSLHAEDTRPVPYRPGYTLAHAGSLHVPLVEWLSTPLGIDRWVGRAHDRWARLPSANVTLIRLRDDGPGGSTAPLLTRFVCERMRAAHGCAWLRATSKGKALANRRSNEAQPPVYAHVMDVLAAASASGLVGADLARRTLWADVVATAFAKVHPEGVLPAPKVRCAAERQLEAIWNFTEAEERRLVGEPEPLSPGGGPALRARFERAVNASAYCSADTNATLQPGGEWQRWLSGGWLLYAELRWRARLSGPPAPAAGGGRQGHHR